MKILSGSANGPLAEGIADYLDLSLAKVTIRRFADGEIYTEINENVRGEDIFILQPTSNPTNDNLMEMLIMVDAALRGSARRITAVIPYFGYARQDRKTSPRSPISAKLVANLMMAAGIDRVVTIDLHAAQIQGFFDKPTDNLYAVPLFARDIQETYRGNNLLIVSPDVGGVVRARSLGKRIGADLAIVDKRRPEAGVSEVMNLIGDVRGKQCIMFDDIVDSAGTLCNAAEAIMEAGAESVSAYCTHGVLTGKAMDRVANSALTELVVTDTIQPTKAVKDCAKIRILSVAELLGEAMLRISESRSVSSLFH